MSVLGIYKGVVADEFKKRGLKVKAVDWQDTSRTKGSSMGPNISDMSLKVDDFLCPIIGPDRFEDMTFDLPSEGILLNVSNSKRELDGDKWSLEKLLSNIGLFVNADVTGNLFLPRDEKILTSVQCCVLPLDYGYVDFNVELYNYQSRKMTPAVLIILSTALGTSVILPSSGRVSLLHDNKGDAHMLRARRLKDVREESNSTRTGVMSAEELDSNMIRIFQVPLLFEKRKPFDYDQLVPECLRMRPKTSLGMDDAQLTVGRYLREWNYGSKDMKIQRDPELPIRLTFQYFKVSDTDEVPIETINDIANMIHSKAMTVPASDRGSLVLDSSDRITETGLKDM